MEWLTRRFKKVDADKQTPRIFLTNTLSGEKELFIPQNPGLVLLYSCGPTVYGPAHIGNLRAYVFSDTLVRTLVAAEYHVRRVINITDFGHLVSDGDEGEDKMTKGLKRENMPLTMANMRILAERYTAIFFDDLEELNIPIKDIMFPRASDYIQEQIALIKTLEQKEYAYRTSDGVYFDTARFPTYGKLGGINVDAQQASARVEKNTEKRNPADFVLWKSDDTFGWQSPWGLGFPGWHIECSAMSRSLLGQEIDIHTGGEDHIAVHHNNELAQSEAASGRKFVHYWLHNAFLKINNDRVAKSTGNVAYLSDVREKGFHPLALRYFFLQAHYRTPLSFSWDALAGADEGLHRLWKLSRDIAEESGRRGAPSEARKHFVAALRDDLATSQALGILWDTLRSEEYAPEEKWGLIEDAEAHFGLSLDKPPTAGALPEADLPADIRDLLARRSAARISRDFKEADRIRSDIESCGYHVDDGPDGPTLQRK
jgi:cysteinyl-tRNA synthetase